MKLFKDLKYVGTDGKLNLYGSRPWHCTSFVTRFKTGEMEFCVQQPHYHENIFMGYTGLNIYVLTEDELVENFKIINEDGTLDDIIHSRDNIKLQEMLNKTRDCFQNMSDEEFKKLLSEY
ncbi:TPA: hypothetical protein N2D99_002026 [Clostridium botulinum]|nr:hypothetical protein [Clostridium botulinum]